MALLLLQATNRPNLPSTSSSSNSFGAGFVKGGSFGMIDPGGSSGMSPVSGGGGGDGD